MGIENCNARTENNAQFETYLYANETNTFIISYYFTIYMYSFLFCSVAIPTQKNDGWDIPTLTSNKLPAA